MEEKDQRQNDDSRVPTGQVGAVGQLTTVSIFVPLFVDGGETNIWSAGGV